MPGKINALKLLSAEFDTMDKYEDVIFHMACLLVKHVRFKVQILFLNGSITQQDFQHSMLKFIPTLFIFFNI